MHMQADISAMVSNRLTLLLDDDLDEVQSASEKLRAKLPDINVDRWVGACRQMGVQELLA